MKMAPGESASEKIVRFRTIGDITCTGAVESSATSLEEIIAEIATSRLTERGTRIDDQRSESAMEDRKKQGYFQDLVHKSVLKERECTGLYNGIRH